MELTETQLSDKVSEFKKRRGNSVSNDSSKFFGIDENTNLTNYYWFRNRFSQEECNKVIEQGMKNNPHKADTFAGESEVRKSNVSWLDIDNSETEWILDILKDCVQEANQDWKIDYCGFWENVQFTHYDGVGSHYDFHLDIGPGHGYRKISIVVQLSESTKYDGGDLVLDTGSNLTTCPRGLGNVILFPSILMHKVTPVTRGERFSLVCWVSGPNWK